MTEFLYIPLIIYLVASKFGSVGFSVILSNCQEIVGAGLPEAIHSNTKSVEAPAPKLPRCLHWY